jgi:hypothetical protein
VVDLEDNANSWVQVARGFPYDALEAHHDGSITRALKLLISVPQRSMQKLAEYDEEVRRLAMPSMFYLRRYKDMFDESDQNPNMNKLCNWIPMDMGDEIVVNVVLEDSDAPTQLVFMGSDGPVTGQGWDFWRQQVGDTPLHDFLCQVRLEFQFVAVDIKNKTMKVVTKAHCIKMALPPKPALVKCTDEELEAFARAVKRIRVNKL